MNSFSWKFTKFVMSLAMGLVYTGLFYTFDDLLAKIVERPWVGEIPYWNLYGFLTFLVWIVATTSLGMSRVVMKGEVGGDDR